MISNLNSDNHNQAEQLFINIFRNNQTPTTPADLLPLLGVTVIKVTIKNLFGDDRPANAFIAYLQEKANAKPRRMDAVKELLMFITDPTKEALLKQDPALFETQFQTICQKLGGNHIFEHMHAHLVSQGPYAIYARGENGHYLNNEKRRVAALEAYYKENDFYWTIHHMPDNAVPLKEWLQLFSHQSEQEQSNYVGYLNSADPDFSECTRAATELNPQLAAYTSVMPRDLRSFMAGFTQSLVIGVGPLARRDGTHAKNGSNESLGVTLTALHANIQANPLLHLRALMKGLQNINDLDGLLQSITWHDNNQRTILVCLFQYFNAMPPHYTAIKNSLLNAFANCVVSELKKLNLGPHSQIVASFKEQLCAALPILHDQNAEVLLNHVNLKKHINYYLLENPQYILNLSTCVQVSYFKDFDPAKSTSNVTFQHYVSKFFDEKAENGRITFEEVLREDDSILAINAILTHVNKMLYVYFRSHKQRIPVSENYQNNIVRLLTLLAACVPKVPGILEDETFQNSVLALLSYYSVAPDSEQPNLPDMHNVINALQLRDGILLRQFAMQYPGGCNSQYSLGNPPAYISFAFRLLMLPQIPSALRNEVLAISDRYGSVWMSWAFDNYLKEKKAKYGENAEKSTILDEIVKKIKEIKPNIGLTTDELPCSGIQLKNNFDEMDHIADRYEAERSSNSLGRPSRLVTIYVPETRQLTLNRTKAPQLRQYLKAIACSMDTPERKNQLTGEVIRALPIYKLLVQYFPDENNRFIIHSWLRENSWEVTIENFLLPLLEDNRELLQETVTRLCKEYSIEEAFNISIPAASQQSDLQEAIKNRDLVGIYRQLTSPSVLDAESYNTCDTQRTVSTLIDWLSMATSDDIVVDIDDWLNIMLVTNNNETIKNSLKEKIQRAFSELPLEKILIMVKKIRRSALNENVKTIFYKQDYGAFFNEKNLRNQDEKNFYVSPSTSNIAHEIGKMIKQDYHGITELQRVIELFNHYLDEDFNKATVEEQSAILVTLERFFGKLIESSEGPLKGNIMVIAVAFIQWPSFVRKKIFDDNTGSVKEDSHNESKSPSNISAAGMSLDVNVNVKDIEELHQQWFMDTIKLALDALKKRCHAFLGSTEGLDLFDYLCAKKATCHDFQRHATLLTKLLKQLPSLCNGQDTANQIAAVRGIVDEHKRTSQRGTHLVEHTEALFYAVEKKLATLSNCQNPPLTALGRMYLTENVITNNGRKAFFTHTYRNNTPTDWASLINGPDIAAMLSVCQDSMKQRTEVYMVGNGNTTFSNIGTNANLNTSEKVSFPQQGV